MLRMHADPRENDSVKKLVFKAVAGLWFDSRYTRSASIPPVAGAGSGRATQRSATAPPTVGRDGDLEAKHDTPLPVDQAGVDPRAAQLVALQAGCMQDKTQAAWLGSLLDRMLGLHEESVSASDKAKAEETCVALVSQIVDYVLLLFEVRATPQCAAVLRRTTHTLARGGRSTEPRRRTTVVSR